MKRPTQFEYMVRVVVITLTIALIFQIGFRVSQRILPLNMNDDGVPPQHSGEYSILGSLNHLIQFEVAAVDHS